MMEQANRILTVLEEAGHEAYIIGGAVRDILMHQKPHDFDIVTSARPDTVIEVLRGHDIQTTDLVGKSFEQNDMVQIAIVPKKLLMPIP